MPRFFFLIAGTLVGAGCALSLDGLSGNSPGDVSDAANPDDAAVLDSTNPPSTSDGGGTADAATGCAALTITPLFCADFDGPDAALADGWDSLVTQNGGTGSLDHAFGLSQSNSFLASLKDSAAGSTSYLTKSFAPQLHSIRLGFDLFTTEYNFDYLASVEIVGGGNSYDFSLACGDSGCQAVLDGGTFAPFGGTLATNRWVRITLEVDLSATANATFTIGFDGSTAYQSDQYAVPLGTGTTAIKVGSSATAAWKGHVDNVVVTGE